MPNLVGTGNNQAPTNAMLGGLAYQDSVGEIIIDKIKARTGDTATDVFVYDTRKDSDGGAWRHRTQNKSWYNEGVSSKRGARKEFPAVAVIVCLSNYIKIYDGDDPNLSLWMDVRPTTLRRDHGWMYGATLNAVTALNGIIAIAANWNIGDEGGLLLMDFVKDELRRHESSGGRTGGELSISQRGTSANLNITNNLGLIIDPYVNDVAMTVLPNAPIDASTGLPVPTIAVGTNGGVSVIRDNGTVNDITNTNFGYNYVTQIKIDEKFVYIGFGASNLYVGGIGYAVPIPSADVSLGNIINATTNANFRWNNNSTSGSGGQSDYYINPSDSNADDVNGTVLTKSGMSFGTEAGSSILLNDQRDGNGSVAFITSSFNSGYMFGDIRGAFLSDTDTTDVAYSTVADDWATAGAWTKQSSITITSTGSGTSGTLSISGNGTGSNVYFFNPITVEANTDYVVSITFGAENANMFAINTTQYSGSGGLLDINALSGSTRGGHFNSGSNTTLYIQGWQQSSTATTITNLVIQKVSEKDRSIKNKGLQVYGTIKKSPVAAGSDLVYYRNFSNTNYFFQPYNSALDFGTGDFYVMFWLQNTQNDAYDDLIHRRAHNGSAYTGNGWYIQMGNDQNITMKDSVGGARGAIDADSFEDTWRHICFVRRSNRAYAYKNGKPQSTNGDDAWTEDLDNSSAVLTIGRGTISGSGDSDKSFLALVRIGAGAPSEEQIKKIYDDEKCLFHENAKCTLYGTSDDVEALAYDDSNDVLHVGTSSGRSEFKGLNRINNTTTAVTTAISASNEFVAEQ